MRRCCAAAACSEDVRTKWYCSDALGRRFWDSCRSGTVALDSWPALWPVTATRLPLLFSWDGRCPNWASKESASCDALTFCSTCWVCRALDALLLQGTWDRVAQISSHRPLPTSADNDSGSFYCNASRQGQAAQTMLWLTQTASSSPLQGKTRMKLAITHPCPVLYPSSASGVMWAWLADVYITSIARRSIILRQRCPAVVQRVWEQGPSKQNRRDVSSLQKWL